MLADADHHARDARRAQQPQLMREKRLAVDFDQRLGNVFGERIEARAHTAGEDGDRQHSAHACANTVVP